MPHHAKKDMPYVTIPHLEKVNGIRHAFTTRLNGLGKSGKDARTPEDWRVVADAFGINTGQVVTVNQVHGENIAKVDALNYRQIRTLHADAMISDVPELALGVQTADCVPVLLFDPVRPAIGAVHAGWRSTVKKIVQKAINRMSEEFGSEPAQLIAAIGPAIGPECYEVDEPVMEFVRDSFSFWREVTVPHGTDHWNLDLVKANRTELLQIGLVEKNIHSVGLCTACRKDLFYSYRAEGKTGRMLSVIMLKP